MPGCTLHVWVTCTLAEGSKWRFIKPLYQSRGFLLAQMTARLSEAVHVASAWGSRSMQERRMYLQFLCVPGRYQATVSNRASSWPGISEAVCFRIGGLSAGE